MITQWQRRDTFLDVDLQQQYKCHTHTPHCDILDPYHETGHAKGGVFNFNTDWSEVAPGSPPLSEPRTTRPWTWWKVEQNRQTQEARQKAPLKCRLYCGQCWLACERFGESLVACDHANTKKCN
jgi:hypothetical protein